MKRSTISTQIGKIRKRLENLERYMGQTLDILERIMQTPDQMEYEKWTIRNDEIYISYKLDFSNLKENEQEETVNVLFRMFPNSRMTNDCIEITYDELIK
jgi:hypothetical protein